MENNKTEAATEIPIAVDLDNIDVADIMAQIKRRIAQRPPSLPEDFADETASGPLEIGWKKRIKNIVIRGLQPFMPLIRRFIIYVTADANKRIDEASGKLVTTMENAKLLHALSHNLVVELTKLKIEEEALKSKVRIMEKDLEMLEKREKALEKKVFS